MYWSTVKCQLRFEKAPRHSARECCIAVAVDEWLAVLWMVRKVGRIRLAARLWRDPAGTIRILMLASRASRETDRGTIGLDAGWNLKGRGVRREEFPPSCWQPTPSISKAHIPTHNPFVPRMRHILPHDNDAWQAQCACLFTIYDLRFTIIVIP